MLKSDFVKGQVIYLKYVGGYGIGDINSIREAVVESVGTKYITAIDGLNEYKFLITDGVVDIGGRDCSEYKLYLSKEEILKEIEEDQLIESRIL